MTGHQLAEYRKQNRRTQVATARALGVSQTYLSLLEAGKRPLTGRVQKRAARFFDLQPTELPLHLTSGELPTVTDDQLAADLADLGYPGFAHLRRKRQRRKNPADVLLTGLHANDRDARVVEAFPWLVLAFPDMNWKDLTRTAKIYDLQNRLGYIVSVARLVAEDRGEAEKTAKLRSYEETLAHSRLMREDTLCNESMTNPERRWLAVNRPDEARKWNLLAGLLTRHLNHYD